MAPAEQRVPALRIKPIAAKSNHRKLGLKYWGADSPPKTDREKEEKEPPKEASVVAVMYMKVRHTQDSMSSARAPITSGPL